MNAVWRNEGTDSLRPEITEKALHSAEWKSQMKTLTITWDDDFEVQMKINGKISVDFMTLFCIHFKFTIF